MTITKSIGKRTWSQPSQDATEDEVRDFLYGLLRLIKPEVAIELGCHHGDASVVMGNALYVNGFGRLQTCDIDTSFVLETKQRTQGLPVDVFQCPARELASRTSAVDFAFVDSGTERFAEAKLIHFSHNAFMVLHDAKQDEYPGLEDFRKVWKQVLTFDTPVGLAMFQIP